MKRYLIVNADDFGLSPGINQGIIEAHENGIVTSASLMVRYAAATEAAGYARMHPALSVGLHFETGEWHYTNGAWRAVHEVVRTSDATAVEEEFRRQLNRFYELLGRCPTHVDSHQHVHCSEPTRSVFVKLAAEMGFPVRGFNERPKYEGGFYGQTAEGEPFPEGISSARLTGLIGALRNSWTELGCHPGYSANLASPYAAEREEEIRVLCAVQVREALSTARVRLSSFHEFMEPEAARLS